MSTARSPVRSRTAGKPSLAAHGVAGATAQRERRPLFVARHGNRPQAERPAHRDRGRTDTARCPVHHEDFTGLGATPPCQGKQGSQVVEGESCARFETHVLGQCQYPLYRSGDDLLPAPVSQEDRNSLTHFDTGVPRGGPDNASGIHTRGVRKRRSHLVLTSGLEKVRERHPGGNDVDQHLTGAARFRHLHPSDSVGTLKAHDLVRVHVPTYRSNGRGTDRLTRGSPAGSTDRALVVEPDTQRPPGTSVSRSSSSESHTRATVS